MAGKSDTPLMRQWQEAKDRHPDCLVMTRLGDFYEFFGPDAQEASRLLGITLTARNNGGASGVALAGVPARARDEHVQTLLRAGRRVAILEQVEDPALAKGLVRREVVETVTPGSVIADGMLQARRNNFLAAVASDGRGGFGIGVADVSTGELFGLPVGADGLEAELARLSPSEILLPADLGLDASFWGGTPVATRPSWFFDAETAREEIERRFELRSVEGLGFRQSDMAILAAVGAVLAYVQQVQPEIAVTLRPPRVDRPGDAMVLDEMTCRNLELVEPIRADHQRRGIDPTLLGVLDRTETAMGARLLRKWILRPLVDADAIRRRSEAVAELVASGESRRKLRGELRAIRDLERLATKVSAGRAAPRELRTLGASLAVLPGVVAALERAEAPLLREVRDSDTLAELADLIARSLADEPPASLGEGGALRDGYDAELDALRATRDGAVDFIAALQVRERERTGISSLKVGFNQVFGYYIEVTKTHLARVPPEWIRKQTIANGERYVTQELKEWEAKALGAEQKIVECEARLYADLRSRVATFTDRVRAVAERIGTVDVLAGFAEVAEEHSYVCPDVHDGYRLDIRQGRHPVVERMMPRERFIPNDVVLDEDRRVLTIQGPNAGGKSTILRQVGLIQLMAQVGSFVPASSALLPICDRIFTRVGASDNLASGQSTYTVEVTETALILNCATRRSLILLDEIGRGTATYDGVSIAWAVTEYLHDEIGAKTIFATHYHELTQLEETLPALSNANVAVTETGDRIVFQYRLRPGGASRSYGIEVARMAGIPDRVVGRAREILRRLESAHTITPKSARVSGAVVPQLSLFVAEPHPVLEKLAAVDVDSLTPLQALTLLAALTAELHAGKVS
jgi:DNA mismatch repair protein MutS